MLVSGLQTWALCTYAAILYRCSASMCQNGAGCTLEPGGKYKCICPDGFLGENCEIDEDECRSFPCQNNGVCHNTLGSYMCCCAPGYTGTHCETTTQCPVKIIDDPCAKVTCDSFPNAKCKTKVVFVVEENGEEKDVSSQCFNPQSSVP